MRHIYSTPHRFTINWLWFLTVVLMTALLLAGLWSMAQAALQIEAKALLDHECDTSEWHFVINQINKDSIPPTTIFITWTNGTTRVVPLKKVTGGVAHYLTTDNLDAMVVSATAEIYDGWEGEFNLSHGPCPAIPSPTPTVCPTPGATPTLKPTPTMIPTKTPSATPTLTPTSIPTSTPTPTVIATQNAEPTVTVTPTPSSGAGGEPSPTPTVTETLNPTPTPTGSGSDDGNDDENDNNNDDTATSSTEAGRGGAVLGISSDEPLGGQVLGYADTGRLPLWYADILMMIGLGMMITGVVYRQKVSHV